ncbi:outer membrane beta-barrel protein [Pedobacter sp. MW01-1-1]|uniref:outer membrane beta-barrel protein n=1 Tax=Pedobacter sp. MW01-1-1 TaxID=3383027 RepID=UPI003FF03F63
MKKLVLSLLAVVGLAYSSQAQTEKGNILLGGTVGFNSTKVTGAAKANTDFSIVPNVGYFINNNFALGTGIGYTNKKTPSSMLKRDAFVVAPFGRYYVDLSSQFKFFGQLSVPMEFGKNCATDLNGDNAVKLADVSSFGVQLAPGFAFFPSKRVGIELSVSGIGYQEETIKTVIGDLKSTTSTFGINADTFDPKLGVQFYF